MEQTKEQGRAVLERLEQKERNRAEMESTRPSLERGDVVVIHQSGISDKRGEVQSVKYSGPTKVWWAEVRLEEDGMTWAVPSTYIVKEES